MERISAYLLLIVSMVALGSSSVVAEARPGDLTLEAIFSPDDDVRVEFGGSPLEGLLWSLDGSRYLKPQNEGSTFQPPHEVEVESGKSRLLFDSEKLVSALAALPDFPEQDAKGLLEDEVRLSPLQNALLLERANDLFHYSIQTGVAKRLTQTPEPEEIARFSPDGNYVSFVRDHDLHVVRVGDVQETVLTRDGGPDLLNGKLDWVYQEEIYGRGDFQGYWWSPDSKYLAFLQLDESPVNRFTLIDHLPTRSRTEIVHYPKAGDPNPKVRLGVVGASGGDILWVDTSGYESADHLIVRVDWTPDSGKVVFLLQDREQTWLDINLADRQTGSVTTLIHETSPAFVDRDLTGKPVWLQDASFLWLSARSGYHHLYHFEPSGALRHRLTDGHWEVREIYGVDERSGWVYFAGSEHSPIEVHIYRIRLDGSGFARLSTNPGSHRALFDLGYSHYLDTWSDIDTPPRVLLHRADGTQIRTVDENRVPELEKLELAQVEFLQVPAGDGFVFEAAVIKPPNFDPAQVLSGSPAQLWWAARPNRQERLGRLPKHVVSVPGAGRLRGLDV